MVIYYNVCILKYFYYLEIIYVIYVFGIILFLGELECIYDRLLFLNYRSSNFSSW